MAKKKAKKKKTKKVAGIRITSGDIERLLKAKHEEDVFVPQCKTGATFSGGRVHILDAWVMKKSWAHPLTTGYEIKVSRGDFLHDEKWRAYLPFCNAFYFVCPTGMIKPEELPADTGLMYVSKTGTKLFTKKKAPYRSENLTLEPIYKYVLMHRAKISRARDITNQIEDWSDWMAQRDADKQLGYNVSRKIRQLVATRVHAVEADNKRLEKQNEQLQQVKEVLDKLGLGAGSMYAYGLEQRIKDAATLLPGNIESRARSLATDLEKFLDGLKTFNESSKEE